MRRRLGVLALTSALAAISQPAFTQSAETDAVRVTVFKQATCSCCAKWIAHMTTAGFVVDAQNVADPARIKEAQHVPVSLRTCHTALVGGYVIEGHVPADVVRTLLRDRPNVTGIGVPGMPKGSPGMESPTPEHYKVLAFRDGRTTVFAER